MNSLDTNNHQPLLQPLNGLASFAQADDRQQYSRLLHAYLILAISLNFGLLFLKGYSQDLGYWQDWVRQLSSTGYDGFNGNYPPLYIHWLYLVGQFYNLTGIPLEHNDLLKFLTQLPVTLFHCLLTTAVYRQLQRFNAKIHLIHLFMLLTVVNPAILINGPIWGQVDLIPAVIVCLAFIAAASPHKSYLAIPLFALALLTKFQMIAFAPVFGFLFFYRIAQHLLGILLAIMIGILVFMPSIIAGHFWQVFRQAYIDTLGQYPMTTFNAANLWILLTGNTAPDNIVLFGVSSDSILAKAVTAKYFGMLLFALTSLLVFFQGIYFFIKHSIAVNERTLLTQVFFSATICALAFFTLLPAMHERYLFPAVVMALAYSALAQKKLIYPIMISMLCGLNMLIILEINGSDIWLGLSLLTVALLILMLLDLMTDHRLFNTLQQLAQYLFKTPQLAAWFFIVATSAMTIYLTEHYRIHQLVLEKNQILLTNLSINYARQDHGAMAINRSFDGNYLSVDGRRYAQGIGTHATSDIQYQLPAGAKEFSFIAALDDEVGTADVQFSVWGDDKLLWQSSPIYGYERNVATQKVDVSGISKLNLKVAPLKDDKWDHANWVNAVISIESTNLPTPEQLPATTPAAD